MGGCGDMKSRRWWCRRCRCKGLRVEVKNELNEEVFYHPIISSSLQSATTLIEGTKQFIFPVINHEARSFRDLNIETITTSLSTKMNWAIRLTVSPHMNTMRDIYYL